MMNVKILGSTGVLVLISVLGMACSTGKAFKEGEYDDPTRVELLDDKFNESDMQQMADTMIKSMVACPYIANAPKTPILFVEKVKNASQEHIDTVALTDKIRTALIKSGKVRFVNKEERDVMDEEYKYNEGPNVNKATQKKRGAQIGADFFLSGRIMSNVQEVGNDKFVYYKLTLNLTNTETSTIDCTEEREIRKKYRKKSLGL